MKKKSTVNKAGNYTKPTLRKRIFQRIMNSNSYGTPSGKWSGRKAQALAKAYKNCLLYTSPSPRDQRGSRMPSSA